MYNICNIFVKIKKEVEEFTYVFDCTKISPGGHIEDGKICPWGVGGGDSSGRGLFS